LVAFGGNGPLFAAETARTLEIGTVLVPLAPGVFSAVVSTPAGAATAAVTPAANSNRRLITQGLNEVHLVIGTGADTPLPSKVAPRHAPNSMLRSR